MDWKEERVSCWEGVRVVLMMEGSLEVGVGQRRGGHVCSGGVRRRPGECRRMEKGVNHAQLECLVAVSSS